MVYATMGTPRIGPHPEDGVTLRWIERAVQLVRDAHSDDTHAIVEHLMGLVPQYTRY